jgi:hypothetical protein
MNMSKLKILLSALVMLALAACSENDGPKEEVVGMEILLLKVDYTTNRLEGGAWLPIENSPETFTTRIEYNEPGDFGGIKVYFSEIDELLFHGDIIWMGRGDIIYPDTWLDAEEFEHVPTYDYFTPRSGFEYIFNPGNAIYNYEFPEWRAAQGLVEVRRILRADPQQVVKLFLYTPSVGAGNPADWKWIIFLADRKGED